VTEAAATHPLVWRPLSGVDLVAETWAVWPPKSAGPAVAQVVDVLTDIVPATHGPRR
jgi:hypothetical protein